MTTITTLTEDQISRLRYTSGEHGDDAMAAICIVAMEGEFRRDDYAAMDLSSADARRIEAMDRDAAYTAIVKAINAAEAQAE